MAVTILFATGALALGGGASFGIVASNQWSKAKDVCGGATTCPTPMETTRANSLADTARSRGNLSTVLFVTGGLARRVGSCCG